MRPSYPQMTINNRLKNKIMSILWKSGWKSYLEEKNVYPQMKMYDLSSRDLVLEGGYPKTLFQKSGLEGGYP